MTCVIDASVTLSWLIRDEHTLADDQLFERVAYSGASVPSLWRLEVANALQIAVRRNRIDVSSRDLALESLGKFRIEVDTETDDRAWTTTLQLADRHKLTVYDAAYLELALRRDLPIATRDQQLARAAKDSGVSVLPTD